MLERSIPFYNTILRCDAYARREVVLPSGFSVVPYRAGYEEDWARMEFALGDFDSAEEAKQYFVSTYLRDPERRADLLFLRGPDQRVIGTGLAWEDVRGESRVFSLHWLVVDEPYQGRGLGRALCTAVMNRFDEKGGGPIYIHTQPWSWKAILLYISLGFRLQKTDTFSRYENQYAQAVDTLRNVVSAGDMEKIIAASEE